MVRYVAWDRVTPATELRHLHGADDGSRIPSALLAPGGHTSVPSLPAFHSHSLREPPQPLDLNDGGRTKLWQLGSPLHCSIIGTCLTTGELRSLLRKFKAVASESPSDHEIHGIAVAAASTRSPLSKQIQKALDHRHGIVVRRFAKAATSAELEGLWEDAKQSGDIPGAYWAVLTHPLATDALVRHVFGDVHMLSHLVGAANRADIRRLHQLEREKVALEEKLARQQAHLRDSIVARDTKIRDLNSLLAARIEQEESAATSPTEVAALRSVVVDLRMRLERESERRRRAELQAHDLRAAHAAAEREHKTLVRELEAVRQELDATEASLVAASDGGQENGPVLDLAGVTLLYVGGRPHLVPRLKALIDRASGEFIHHDGGIDEKMDLLPGLVSRANVVFFPVDCISHDAAQSLKRLCRQLDKPFVPLRSSGATSLLYAVRKLDAPRPVG